MTNTSTEVDVNAVPNPLFRGRLLEGSVLASYHGERGPPIRGRLILCSENQILRWKSSEMMLCFGFKRAEEICLKDINHIRIGRQSRNFVRTLKYIQPSEALENDAKCLSIFISGTGIIERSSILSKSFDFEFASKEDRDAAINFLTRFSHLVNTDGAAETDLDDSFNDYSIKCFQLLNHPSFHHLILLSFIIDFVVRIADIQEGVTFMSYYLLILLGFEHIVSYIAMESFRRTLYCRWRSFHVLIVVCSSVGLNILPLRLVHYLFNLNCGKSYRTVIDTYARSLPNLLKTLALYLYYLLIFGTIYLYLFDDLFTFECKIYPNLISGNLSDRSMLPRKICKPSIQSFCSESSRCLSTSQSQMSRLNFESFRLALATTFILTLGAGYGGILESIRSIGSSSSILMFIAGVLFLSHAVIPLITGVVRNSFYKQLSYKDKMHLSRELAWSKYRQKRRTLPLSTDIFPDIVAVGISKMYRFWTSAKQSCLKRVWWTRISLNNYDESTGWSCYCCRVFKYHKETMAKCCQLVCRTALFQHLIATSILVNVFIVTFEDWLQRNTTSIVLPTMYIGSMIVFMTEFVIVCAASNGLASYMKSSWNPFCFIALCMNLLEILKVIPNAPGHAKYAQIMYGLRLFQLLNSFSKSRKHSALARTIDALYASSRTLFSCVLLYTAFTVIFAVIGQTWLHYTATIVNGHFSTLGEAMISLLKVSVGVETLEIIPHALDTGGIVFGTVFFITYFMFGVWTIAATMLVVVQTNFIMKSDEKRQTMANLFTKRMRYMQRVYRFETFQFLHDFASLYQKEDITYSTAPFVFNSTNKVTGYKEKTLLKSVMPVNMKMEKKIEATPKKFIGRCEKHEAYSRLQNKPSFTSARCKASDTAETTSVSTMHLFTILHSKLILACKCSSTDVSLFLFPRNSRFRRRCRELEKSSETFIFVVIVIRTILLTLESPLYSSTIQQLTRASEVAFAGVLLFEFAVKVVAQGFLFTPNSYLSDRWNQLNMLGLLACSLLLLLPKSTMATLFVLGRALGPVRVFYRVKTFRVITKALLHSTKQIICGLLLTLLVVFFFAAILRKCLSSNLAMCNDPLTSSFEDCVGVYFATESGMLVPRVWGYSAGGDFHDFMHAMTSTSVLLFTNNMPDDTAGESAVVLLAIKFAGHFFILNAFAGVIVNNFRCHNGKQLLTRAQLVWYRVQRELARFRPLCREPSTIYASTARSVVQSNLWKIGVKVVPALHAIFLALLYNPKLSSSPSLARIHYTFALLYFAETTMHATAVGWTAFCSRRIGKHQFRMLLAIIMLTGSHFAGEKWVRVVGLVRMLLSPSIFKLFRGNLDFHVLCKTLKISRKELFKVSLLLSYVLFLFATIGMQLYAQTKWTDGIHEGTNFATFPNAFAASFQAASGEKWLSLLQGASTHPPSCVLWTASHQGDCGAPAITPIVFGSFYILVLLVLRYLYLATIVDSFMQESTSSVDLSHFEYLVGCSSFHFKTFTRMWRNFDPDAIGYIHRKQLLPLLIQLDAPLGIGSYQDTLAATTRNAPTTENKADTYAVAQRTRMQCFYDIQGRLSEIAYRHQKSKRRQILQNVLRFQDVLYVVVSRLVQPRCRTVEGKVDELVIRDFVHRHMQAVRIQALFRAYRIRIHRRRRSSCHLPTPSTSNSSTIPAYV